MTPQPNHQAAVDFLGRFRPGGPWVLASVSRDKSSIITATFRDPAKVLDWLEQRGADRNTYYVLNEAADRAYARPPEIEDILPPRFLHVDIDPRAGEDLAAEQDRMLKRLTADLPPGVPPPSIIVFSGRGYQAIWRLEEACPDAAERNYALELAFGADACHNVNRLLRLPGTVNQKTGCTAQVVRDEPGAYSLCPFKSAALPARAQIEAVNVNTTNVTRVGDINTDPRTAVFKGKKYARLRVIAVQGRDPDKPKDGDDSRSAWLNDFLCNGIRAGAADDTLFAIITDQDFGISASVLDKKDPSGEALKQIAKAHAQVNADDDDNKPGPRDIMRDMLNARQSPLLRYNDEWFGWAGGVYVPREKDVVRREIYDYAETLGEKPAQKWVTNLADALCSLTICDKHTHRPPCWLDRRPNDPDPKNLLVCANGIVDLTTGKIIDHDSRLLTFNKVDYAYDPAAPVPPLWAEKFLKEAWPDDSEQDCIDALQMAFGYSLTADTSQQKIFLLIGPRRSGKGTIARVWGANIGQHNVFSPKIADFGTNFGLQAAINKRLAIITDMRIGSRTDRGTLVSRLLSISGEDHQTIPRKYLDDWEGYLTTRIVIMTNELPQILDVSGALVSRYIVLPMEQSFLGREDLTLTDKLCKQRAGILNWAIAGRQMLTERGRFTQTTAGEEKVRQLRRLTSQVVAFIEDCCRYDAEAKTDKDPLYQAYAFWAADQGLPSLCKEVFCKDLLEISEGRVREYKPWKAEGPRLRSFKGIALAGEPAYPAAASITPVQAVQAGY